MTPREIKIRREERGAAKDYLKKAMDNYEQMLLAMERDNYNAAATLAIQCGISAADAICVFEKGMRSISADHLDVCALVESLAITEAVDKARILRKIIAKKNMVQYERRNIFLGEAEEIAKLATRFYQWVSSILAKK
jgi:HEPN domain-containing protein